MVACQCTHAAFACVCVCECLQMLAGLGCVGTHTIASSISPLHVSALGQEGSAQDLEEKQLDTFRVRGCSVLRLRQPETKEVKKRQRGRDGVCLYAEEEATVVR